MEYKCEIINRESQPALSIRTRTPIQNMPQVLGNAFGSIMQYLGEIGENPSGAPYVGFYNLDMQDLDIEIGFPTARSLEGKENIKSSEIPAGRYGFCLHIGPYSASEPAYTALTEFVKKKGFEPSGIAYEIYLNDPQSVPEEKLQTQVLFLLK
jgi:effector-binding domain-containing protein